MNCKQRSEELSRIATIIYAIVYVSYDTDLCLVVPSPEAIQATLERLMADHPDALIALLYKINHF